MSTRQETIQIDHTPWFIPPHVGGDTEFKGHGPNVSVSAKLTVRNVDELWAIVSMHARETKKDWTEVDGTAYFQVYKHDKPILRILSDNYSSWSYRDTDHADDVFTLGEGELVNQFRIVGDTKGKEAGIRTGVMVYFNPITVEVPA